LPAVGSSVVNWSS